jgi:hypothetical protein
VRQVRFGPASESWPGIQLEAVGQLDSDLVESAMKNTFLRILIGVMLTTLISGIVVSTIGLIRGWKAPQFSDGLFWASLTLIAIGFISLRGYSQRIDVWPPVKLDRAEGSKLWVADALRGKHLMTILGISGLLLFGLSVLVSSLA